MDCGCNVREYAKKLFLLDMVALLGALSTVVADKVLVAFGIQSSSGAIGAGGSITAVASDIITGTVDSFIDRTYCGCNAPKDVNGICIRHCGPGPQGPNGTGPRFPQEPPPHVDPLVIDLNKDGKTDLTRNTYFDIDANGFAEATNWIDNSDGLLAIDRNGNGIIDDGKELFGDRTIKSDGTYATSGFDALADIDLNGDGIIDVNDSAFSQLRVWNDANGDGISQQEELQTFEEVGIESINLNYLVNGEQIEGGEIGKTGEVSWENGETSIINEVNPYRNPLISVPNEILDVPDNIKILPDLTLQRRF
jgi:hypothetical protein